jgi:hypothetical protein
VTGPDFDQLFGDEVSGAERERLRGVHDLLVAAGPPPELSPALESPPDVGGAGSGAKVLLFPRRRRAALLLIAAALAAAAFGGGYFAGGHGRGSGSSFESLRAVQMHGTAAAPRNALATIELGKVDDAGNWPMLVTVQGLPVLGHRAYYELYLTRNGRIAAPCGTFTVHAGTTKVHLNAPYQLSRFDGWVVTKHVVGQSESNEPLLTT